MTIGVVVLRALNVWVGIARTANPDVVSSFSMSATRYLIVLTMMIGQAFNKPTLASDDLIFLTSAGLSCRAMRLRSTIC